MDTMLRRRAMMAGAEPSPLVFYDRLVFDGTAYIETDIIPPALASFRVTLGNETVIGAQRLFMNSCDNSGYTGITITGTDSISRRTMNIYYCSQTAALTGMTVGWTYTNYTLYLTPTKTGVGDNQNSISAGNKTPNGGMKIGTNVAKNGQPFSGRMGRFLIYGPDAQNATGATDLLNNYTPMYDLRPCTYNGEAGFWCMETSTFYGNTAGAGTLSVMNNS